MKTTEEETLMPPRTPSSSDMKTLAKEPLEASAENCTVKICCEDKSCD